MPDRSRGIEPGRRRGIEPGRRRGIEIALGALWLLDGALQFQPFMFTKDFMAGTLGMANMGLPGPLSVADYHVASMLAAHPAFWNAAFATLQVAIGAGLLFGRGRLRDAARGVSVLWALGVWTIGEGVGAMFMGGTSLLTGAPGAALLYAVVAILIWPPRIRAGAAKVVWTAVWVGAALLEISSINHAAGVPGAQVANGAFGEPGFVASFDRAVGHALAGGGPAFAAVLGAAAAAVGLGVLWASARRAALIGAVALTMFVGFAGQDLGAILTGHGTDPGTAPVLALLAVVLWPERQRAVAATAPRPAREVSASRSRVRVAATTAS